MGEDAPTLADGVVRRHRAKSELGSGAQVGRYVIDRVIGVGGMGIIYLAKDPKLDRPIALKLVLADVDPASLVREARALAKLQDPNVVAVYDAGELDDGRVYIAMQYVDGEDLEHALARRDPPTNQILAWFVAAGRGLAAAHAAGLVHRDFKPGNVLLDARGRIAVTDFGLAQELHGQAKGVAGFAGTPAYMAPEQFDGGNATEASDQFAFCVALWEALFGRHPFIEGTAGSMSPYAIAMAITEGELITPPARTRVSRKVVDALTRGLARDPAKRWPSMTELLDVLAPPARGRRWPIVLGAGIAAGALATGGILFATRGDDLASCGDRSAARAVGAWTPALAQQIHTRFAASGLPYAANASRTVDDGLGRYASRWQQLATDACEAERSEPASEALARRRACLDARLDAMRSLAGLLANESDTRFVEHAQAMVGGLPDLTDCTTLDTIGAPPTAPPPEKAAAVDALEKDLLTATARAEGGQFDRARPELAAIAKRADDLAWPPSAARAHREYGALLADLSDPNAVPELLHASELATANHMDRDAARAMAVALRAAGWARQQQTVTTLAPLARAAAARTADRKLELAVEIDHGRALARMHELPEAIRICRQALEIAPQLQQSVLASKARDCLIEALAPAGEWREVRELTTKQIEVNTPMLGADHPQIADYYAGRVTSDLRQGKLAEARSDGERALAIRRRVYDANNIRIAQSLSDLGDVAATENKVDEARKLYEQGLAIAQAANPTDVSLIVTLHTTLAYVLLEHDRAGAMRHFQEGLEFARDRTGRGSLEVAILLLNYGQVKAEDDFEAGRAMFEEARAILDAKHDPRAQLAIGALAHIESQHGRWADARVHAEQALGAREIEGDLRNTCVMQLILAQALANTHGDMARARQLATSARDLAAKFPDHAQTQKDAEAWLASHR